MLRFILNSAAFVLLSFGIFSQQENINSFEDFNYSGTDYKIINSNSSFLELEYIPEYLNEQTVNYNNDRFSIYNFKNSATRKNAKEGTPDLRRRIFPVFFPSLEKNSIQIIEVQYKEIQNVNLAPVPSSVFKIPFNNDFNNIEYAYLKDISSYSSASFIPSDAAFISDISPVRENLLGYLEIYPCQYNPAAKTLKQITKIRIRINFGKAPLYLNRKRSSEEIRLLKDIAVNFGTALNWRNPDLKIDKHIIISAMKYGDWYKLEIKDNGTGSSEGIYKLTKSYLQNAGINVSGIDPRTIKMYGNGGGILSDDFNIPRIEDLQQIAIHIEGEDNGVFDDNDYILFYAKSINNWKYNYTNHIYEHYVNPYSKSNYYWICFNTSGSGKRMIIEPPLNVPNPIVISSFKEKLFYEPEEFSINSEGNYWFSHRVSNGQSFIWNTSLNGLMQGSDISYKIRAASRVICPNQNHMEIREENSTMPFYNFNMGCVTIGWDDWIWTGTASFSINQSQKTNGEQSSVKSAFYCTSAEGEGYIDWMETQYQRSLTSVKNDFIEFDSPEITGTTEYNLSPFSSNDIRVFDISVHDNVRIISPLNISSGSVKFQRNVYSPPLSNYAAAGPAGYKTPASISQKISNQDIHGSYNEGASFIIISPAEFVPAANRLKQMRESSIKDYVKTFVIDVKQVYNEFSGGVLDPTAIRDFVKYAFDNWTVKPCYVLLLGDGNVDYRNIITNNPVWIPPWEVSHVNLNQQLNYCTDDYFVKVIGIPGGKPDLAIGRIPANTFEEAADFINKIEEYENGSTNGYWKNKLIFVADDGKTANGNDGDLHTRQCETLAEEHCPGVFEKMKLYLVMYPAVITSQGRRKPGVNRDIERYWNEGCIGINYTGHGSPELWAHEQVLEKDVITRQLHNTGKYPFLTVASCDFSKFDNIWSNSGGEELMIHRGKGAIGTFAATRPVDAYQNEVLNNALWTSLYQNRDTSLFQKRLGIGTFEAKNGTGYDLSHIKYVLMGDPTVRLQTPRYESRIDSIIGLAADTMRALSKITIYGKVIHPDTSIWSSYNGSLLLKIFDVPRHIDMLDEESRDYNFTLPGGIIFSGTQQVKDGRWKIEFVVPKDISFQNNRGKIINYFYNPEADGQGMFTNFFIGGINPNAALDTTGPDISIFLNNRSFKSGDVVNNNFKLLVDFFDESGINTTGTIGHKIDGVLDGNENDKIDLTSFYTADSLYKYGHIEYDFSSIADGVHSLKVKAWDTYNNSSDETVNFKISSSSAVSIMNVYNFPNPFTDKTSFTFQHNYPEAIAVRIKIYTVAGRLIEEIDKENVPDKFVKIDWNGTDRDGEKLANGIYIYKLTIITGTGESKTETGKLAVLR